MTRKTSTKQRPTRSARSAAKKPQLPAVRAVLPVRPSVRPSVRPHTDTPPTLYSEFISEDQIAAAYQARLADLPLIPITAWKPGAIGSVTALFPSGATLTHTAGTPGFDALTPCPQGATHHNHITNGAQLREAAAAAAHCTQLHGRPRTLTLAQAATTTADTQALTRNDIDTGLTNRAADTEKPKGHPQS
ncbi:hypothetical protein [Streptomyces sp. NPDC058092]|uniref:hypothetical protein n=1 Tax=Streptomyces sp. NPDC058092 TaxID=3346336 RepID=UPI0036EB6BC1